MFPQVPTFLSLFSGIEAASCAWLPLGWTCVGVAEVEKFPCQVLRHHYPDVPNLGDVTAPDFLARAAALLPDVIVGGSPSRDGDGDGAPLIAHSLRADGFDASEDGTGRGTPLVPVYVPDTMPALTVGHGGASGHQNRQEGNEAAVIAFQCRETPLVPCMAVQEDNQNGVTVRDTAGSLRSDAPGTQPCGTLVFDTTQITHPENRCNPQPGAPCHPLAAGAHAPAIAFQSKASASNSMNPSVVAPTLGVGNADGTATMHGAAVRRLTPVECARLQGFPDNYLDLRGAADGPKYRALGNSMAVPCMAWIGRRLQLVAAEHTKLQQLAALFDD